MPKRPRKQPATPHEKRMAQAIAARRKHGLNEHFSQETAIRNEMVELRAALLALPEEPGHASITNIKQELQQTLADRAEQLYHLINGPTH